VAALIEIGAARRQAALQRVGVLVEIPSILSEMKVEPEPLLASLGPHRAALSDMDGWLPFPVISDLVLQCIAATGRNDFPLVLGASARIRHWGVMGKLLSAAADLRSALVEFVANHPRYARGAGAYLVDCGEDGLLLGYRIHYPGLRAAAPFSLGAMAFALACWPNSAASNRRGSFCLCHGPKTSRLQTRVRPGEARV
jgi:Arabinose-binding domain of AraC transcription regulator, N-term